MPGTRDDAMLLVELAKWGAMMGLDEAAQAIWSDDFDPDAADAQDPAVRKILLWNETIGTRVKNGLFDRGLVYDWLWVQGAWSRVGPAATRAREKAGVAQLFENFEALAAGQHLSS